MKKTASKPGPKSLTVSLYPLKPEEALRAFMKVDPKALLARERRAKRARAAKRKKREAARRP